MNKYKVSVIVPVYNAEKYIEQCVESILNQTLKEIELILVNDGSTDNSLEIIKKYEKQYNNVTVIDQTNQGVMSARCNGYEKAKGEYVAFVDNDDFVDSEMYEKLYKKASNQNLNMVICNYAFYPKPIKEKQKWFNEYKGIMDWKFVNKNTLLWNRIIKKDYLDKMDIKNLFSKMGEASFMLLLINAEKVDTINEELYHYRVGQQSLSLNFNNTKWHEQNIINAKERRNHIKGTKLEKEWAEFLDYGIYYSLFKILLITAKIKDRQKYKRYKKEIREYKNNKYIYTILKNDFGMIKTFLIMNIITKNYTLTSIISKII